MFPLGGGCRSCAPPPIFASVPLLALMLICDATATLPRLPPSQPLCCLCWHCIFLQVTSSANSTKSIYLKQRPSQRNISLDLRLQHQERGPRKTSPSLHTNWAQQPAYIARDCVSAPGRANLSCRGILTFLPITALCSLYQSQQSPCRPPGESAPLVQVNRVAGKVQRKLFKQSWLGLHPQAQE